MHFSNSETIFKFPRPRLADLGPRLALLRVLAGSPGLSHGFVVVDLGISLGGFHDDFVNGE